MVNDNKTKKLNYLIVMPRLVKNIGDGYSFPLGIAYISAVLKKANFNVFTLNLNHREGKIFDIIQKEIKDNNINVIATGGLSFQYATIHEVIESAKKADNKITTIVGGGIITSDPEPAMTALEYADYGILGEGEITISELCKALESDKDYERVDGLIYKLNGKYKRTKSREEIKDLDSIPWPDYKGFELDKYLMTSPSISGINQKNTVFMIASRSCPYNCTFCFHTVGQKYRQRSLDKFFEELDYLIKEYKIDFVCLADELFSVNPERVKEFCKRITPYKIKWWAQFRVDHITKNPELLPVLKAAGCKVMSFGLESADNTILKSMKKNTTIEQAEEALKLVYESGISPEGCFIFGDLEETWETANNTLRWWHEHSQYKITLNLITIYPGTPLYFNARARGLIKDRVQFLKNGCPQVNVSKLNDKEFSLLVREIMESPMTMTKTLSNIEAEIIDAKTGRVKMSGDCEVCGKKTQWANVKLFSSSFLACKHCSQRYNIILPKSLKENLEQNIKNLLEKHGKLALWGINYHIANIFKDSRVLKSPNIFPIEISEVKQKMDLYGKKVNSPEIIQTENIETIIIPIPAYINEITERIKTNYKNVKKIIDICELVDPHYSKKNSNEKSINECIGVLEKYTPYPEKGLPKEVFAFISRITPLINVELLVQDERGRTLLAWRDDLNFGPGWHLPGGIIRFKETFEKRIEKVAEKEIGTHIKYDPSPLLITQTIGNKNIKIRGHGISLLYKCFLSSKFIPENKGLTEKDNGFLKWHDYAPKNLIQEHQIYKKFIEGDSNGYR